ncbi:hypothetical protein ACHAWX_002676 [Stephanocyclus meneghinianus]
MDRRSTATRRRSAVFFLEGGWFVRRLWRRNGGIKMEAWRSRFEVLDGVVVVEGPIGFDMTWLDLVVCLVDGVGKSIESIDCRNYV